MMKASDDEEKLRPHQDRFSQVVLGVVTGLIGVGVVGLWGMNASVSRLEARVEQWSRIFEAYNADVKSMSTRVGVLEANSSVSINRIDRIEREQASRGPRIERLEHDLNGKK